MKVFNLLPGLRHLADYDASTWRIDLQAGITVSVLLVPQVMAYAMLAGLPPVYGLYASTVPLFVYALLGSSPQLSVGPTALVSLLVISSIGALATPMTQEYIYLAILVGLIAGALQLLLGAVRLGVLVSFLSRPVISGFTSAAALIIMLSQSKYLLAIDLPRSNRTHETFLQLLGQLPESHMLTALLSGGFFLLLLLQKRWLPRLPGALTALVLGTILVAVFRLDRQGITIVGDIPSGLPAPIWPALDWPTVRLLLPAAATIGFISFVESLAIGKTLESRFRYYRIRPNQELIALGFSKLLGSFFQSYPTTGSFGRSAVNADAGARTGIASMVAAIITVLVLLFLTPLFYYLPQAVLSVVIVLAVAKLFDWREMQRLWQHDRRDGITLLATFLVTLAFGIQQGIIAGVLLSLALVIYRNARPHIAVLGRLPHTPYFRNVSRFQHAVQEDDILIIRFDSQLYFGNADYFRETIEALIAAKGPDLKLIILDASSIHDLDSTGVYILTEVLDDLEQQRIEFYLSGVIGPVRDVLFRTGMMEKIGPAHQFLDIADAVRHYREREGARDWSVPAVQTNYRKREGGKRSSAAYDLPVSPDAGQEEESSDAQEKSGKE